MQLWDWEVKKVDELAWTHSSMDLSKKLRKLSFFNRKKSSHKRHSPDKEVKYTDREGYLTFEFTSKETVVQLSGDERTFQYESSVYEDSDAESVDKNRMPYMHDQPVTSHQSYVHSSPVNSHQSYVHSSPVTSHQSYVHGSQVTTLKQEEENLSVRWRKKAILLRGKDMDNHAVVDQRTKRKKEKKREGWVGAEAPERQA